MSLAVARTASNSGAQMVDRARVPYDDSASSAAPAVTTLPHDAESDERGSSRELMIVVYDELRCLADRLLSSERPGQTLQPTALVHEAYLRLAVDTNASWENRAHFFGAASRAIRRILIDRARAKRRLKRGGGDSLLPLDVLDVADTDDPRMDLLALDVALERLARVDPQKARVVELRFFGGLSEEEIGLALGLSSSTVTREWRFARIWLHRELSLDGTLSRAP